MYVGYIGRKGWKYECVDVGDGYFSLEITGQDLKVLYRENGKHAVQRRPKNDRSGRPHTSMAVVGVMPILTPLEFSLRENDLVIETMRGSGKGGQHRNKTDSCVRITHVPTGIRVKIDSRSQSQNKARAREILESKVFDHYNGQRNQSYQDKKSKVMSNAGRSGKIRTYNFVESRVTDHQSGKKSFQLERILKGELELLFQ